MLVIEFDDEKVVRCNDSSIWVAGNEYKDAERGAKIINNHDRMVEEIAELKRALLEIKNTPDVRCDECPSIASAALAKLNQEGEG
ncbi:hypothetical protein VPHK165_0010 [Vibrio phage K165]|nr:hypothetical protein MYOV022v2_p0007 [Vibrio phage 12E28.1]QZI90176.1 hypothetical protein MYOV021v2_p0007 [Vibrio phage 18E29.1]QZI90621.1 hypothetical protein MYOV023v1_p0074 [Vibrio phage 91E28.1a]QZI90630.1 hypothetical protein MYOV020v1_p0004 [Vibrio phage 98E28.6a]